MLVPLNWLREYVELPANPAELIERLTLAGLESSGIRLIGVPCPDGVRVKPEEAGLPWDTDKVVVAKVHRIEKHPDADKLKLVTVDYGATEPKTVVTGAPNIAPGQSGMKVVLGLRGSRYFYTDKDGTKKVFTLEAKALRGIMNDAMCMSNYELGIAEDHDGIIILDDNDPAPGTPLQDVLGDIVVELDVLPNMARCLAMLGIAREVAALTGKKVKPPELTFPMATDKAQGQVEIAIEDAKLCPRYSATIIRNVKIGPSPRWMQTRLLYAGMRPINNVVDITNYVMLEFGQPLHAFDFDALVKRANGKTPKITTRPARAGETLKTLDNQVRELGAEHLVIADEAGPIALAGVMGGLETEVTATTTTLLLESASFDAVSVRKTARQFTLFSEASTRFSKGVHSEVVPLAAQRASHLFQKYAGGEVLAGVVEQYPAPAKPQVIDFKHDEIERLLGFTIPDEEVVRILTALQFQVEATAHGWKVTTPPNRLDIQSGSADLIEELARVSGYDKLKERLLKTEMPEPKGNRTIDVEQKAQDLLVDLGLSEVITYAMSSPKTEELLAPISQTSNDGKTEDKDMVAKYIEAKVGQVPPVKELSDCDRINASKYIVLRNPISPERSVMRTTLIPGVLEVAARNLQNFDSVALFELGFVYLFPSPPGGRGVRGEGEAVGTMTPSPPGPLSPSRGRGGDSLPTEPRRLCIVLSGRRTQSAWDDPLGVKPSNFDFYDLKGVVDSFLNDLHVSGIAWEGMQGTPHLHPGRSAKLTLAGKDIGAIGELHPKVAKAFDLGDRAVLVAELDAETILQAVPERYAYRPFSTLPSAKRDVAVIVAEDLPADRVMGEILAAGGELLAEATLFDVYRGESIPAGTKSLAYALKYQPKDKTLTDKELDKVHQKIEGRLKHVLNAQIRGKEG